MHALIIAFTGAGISKASGIPTFEEMGDLREKLDRFFAKKHPDEYKSIISQMEKSFEEAVPNDGHIALAEYGVPVITMNIDKLHTKAGSEHVLELHGTLPNIVLYGDQAPNYAKAFDLIWLLGKGDILLIVGTSYYTNISTMIKYTALERGVTIVEINEDAEHKVREFLESNRSAVESWDKLIDRYDSRINYYTESGEEEC